MTAPETVYGLVLTGGKSRRMGSDKAALLTGGETQLERAVRVISPHVAEAFVSARGDQADDPVRAPFPQIIDRYDDLGPVAGILSAMDTHPDAAWLVLACDLPNIDDRTIRFLLDNTSENHPVTAFVSVVDGMPEPLCAVYRPESRAIIDRFVSEGIKCPRKMLINSDTQMLEQPNPGALHNINRPEDLEGTGIEIAS